jgi:hypothetical protein
MEAFKQGSSNIVWCEYIVQGHAYHPHVGEFWNTFTSIAFFCVIGLWGVMDSVRNGYPLAHIVANIMLIVVGFGSAMFHATESYAGELLDELPMSLMGFAYLLCTDRMNFLTSEPYRTLTFGVGLAVVVVAWTAYFWLHNFEIFQICFVFQVAYPAFLSLFSGSAPVFSSERRLWWAFLAIVIFGRVSWDYERWLNARGRCPASEWDPRFWLHANWHVCSAAAHAAWMTYAGAMRANIIADKETAA